METRNYTDAEKEKIGQVIADILMLHKRKNKYGYETAWGWKTPRGIYETVLRLNEEIQAGTLWTV